MASRLNMGVSHYDGWMHRGFGMLLLVGGYVDAVGELRSYFTPIVPE